MDFLGDSHNSLKNIYSMWPKLEEIDKDIINQVANDARYDVYIKRQKSEIEETKKNSTKKIPEDFNYKLVNGLSNEILSKLELIRPVDLMQASRIEGMTPSALTLLHLWIKKHRVTERDLGQHGGFYRDKSSA